MDATDDLVLIVTGAHLDAERHDRPLAYWLLQRLEEAGLTGRVIVCSDLWYLNNDALRSRPTISVGGPEVNALSAYLASRLPSVLAVENEWVVLLDVDAPTPLACCWGRHAGATTASVQAFASRHLAAFVENC